MTNGLVVPVREMATKVCNKCREAKPLDSFHRNRKNADGMQASCKQCVQDYWKEYGRRMKARKAYQAKKALVPAAIEKKQAKLTIVLNDDCAVLSYSAPLSAADFNILIRAIGLQEGTITGRTQP